MARIGTSILICLGLAPGWTPLHAQARPARVVVSFEIVPGRRFGPIAEDTSRAALASLVPPRAVRAGDIEIGEGFCASGVRVFPETNDELEVAWQDAAQTRVAFARARRPGSGWHTTLGVTIGMRLTDLERLAGRVLTFSGFGWDYGGGATWTEGGGEIGLRLAIDPLDAAKPAAAVADLHGDRIVRSDHQAVRSLRIRVAEISQDWGQHVSEHDCR